MVSVLVAKSVPELSKDIRFVPVFGSELFIWAGPFGGHNDCTAATNSRSNRPCCAGIICSCQTYEC